MKGQPNPPGVDSKPGAEVTHDLALRNLDRCLDGIVAKASDLLAHAP